MSVCLCARTLCRLCVCVGFLVCAPAFVCVCVRLCAYVALRVVASLFVVVCVCVGG